MIVLGIETSCDETGVALYDNQCGILSEVLYSQVAVHQEYGGVVPELASRDHIKRTIPLIKQVLMKAKRSKQDIEAVAYTCGPGLSGALLVGICVGRTLAFALQVPSVGVHHMEGHLLSPMLESDSLQFPFLALLVSGGHTLLVKVNGIGQYIIMGESVDDAVGEAFDKVSVMLGMGYPGGPLVAELAKEGRSGKFNFPRPMLTKAGLNFSFSGLKTHTSQTIKHCQKNGVLDQQTKADIALAFEEAVVETLTIKCEAALCQTGLKKLVIGGGVGANQRLRVSLKHMVQKQEAILYCPREEFCTDNGVMIAYAGCQRLLAGHNEGLSMAAKPRWDLSTLDAI